MSAAVASSTVEVSVTQAIIAAIGVIVSALLGGLGIVAKSRYDERAKKIEAKTAEKVARIEADSSQELTVTQQLFSQVEALRNHNAEQDKATVELVAQIGDLKAEIAKRDALLIERDRTIAKLAGDLHRVKVERNEALESLSELRRMVGLAEGETEAWTGEES